VTVRIVIADDEAMMRAGLTLLISGEPDLEVVGEASDGLQAVDVVTQTQPDVVLMDVRMPHLDGIEAAARIADRAPNVHVVILTTFDEDAAVEGALRGGVAGFLLKTSPPEDLVAAIRAAAAGRGSLDPTVVPRVIAAFSAIPPAREPAAELALLTARETDVLCLVGKGLSNAEIAAELYLGETTVKTHLGRVLHKLDLRDRNRAIAFAYSSGLIEPEHSD
jgi:DNA-binding NarL/FixJ family response regulator